MSDDHDPTRFGDDTGDDHHTGDHDDAVEHGFDGDEWHRDDDRNRDRDDDAAAEEGDTDTDGTEESEYELGDWVGDTDDLADTGAPGDGDDLSDLFDRPDWVDADVLAEHSRLGPIDAQDDGDLPGTRDIDRVALELWERARPGHVPAVGVGTEELLHDVAETSPADVDRSAARILLGMLAGPENETDRR